MREFGLLSETDPSLPSIRLEVSLYDDYEFFLPLESDFLGDAPSTNVEEVFGPRPLCHLLMHPFLVPQ